MSFPIPRLYAIIDSAQTAGRSPVAVADQLLAAGVKLVQCRAKRATARQFLDSCRQIAERARGARAIFIVNDRADIALAVDAEGVHVGQDDLPPELARRFLKPGKWIGYSTHSLNQVLEAERTSADYIAFGPVFPTHSKENPDPVVGLDGLRRARRATRKPLVAIGGITAENARSAIEAGADSVAVMSDLVGARDIESRTREFLKAVEEV
ncbi:MAG TPA: thiamine phosphate synthase [Terriglobia bacterium]|nr:thiamine phosphate synthase [Terriglobia bacterium]